MTFSDFNCHTNQLFYDFKLLKVRDIIKSQQLKLVFEFRKNLLPIELQKLFKLASDVHHYDTISASNHLLHIAGILTSTYGRNSIKFQCPALWNITVKKGISINNNVKNNIDIDSIHNVHQFKNILKKHFLYKSILYFFSLVCGILLSLSALFQLIDIFSKN